MPFFSRNPRVIRVTNSGPPGRNLIVFEHAMLAMFEHAMLAMFEHAMLAMFEHAILAMFEHAMPAIKILRKTSANMNKFCFWNSQSLPKPLQTKTAAHSRNSTHQPEVVLRLST
jgi:hypothetical protein